MPIDLKKNNYELVRAAWTAMDQTYGSVAAGYDLQPIDNSGNGRIQPWETPSGYTVRAVIEDKNLGGKFTLYKNDETNTVLLNAIGTNGNKDAVGWYTNLKDFGLSQWRSGTSSGDKSVKEQTFLALNELVDTSTTVIVNGDSKGMALSNFIVHDLVEDRDAQLFENDPGRFGNLSTLTNDQIAIVGRVGPGVEEIIKKDDPSFNPNGVEYAGISVDYRAPKLANSNKTEIVHQLGGDSINGNGEIQVFSEGVVNGTSNPIDAYAYLHRLVNAGYDHLAATNGDFGQFTVEKREHLTSGELASYGSFFGSIGQGNGVSTFEARLRFGTDIVCAVATSPLSTLQTILEGKLSATNTMVGIGALFLEATPIGKSILLGGCAIGVVGENAAGFLGDGMGGLTASDTSLAFAVSSTEAPKDPPPGTQRLFGRTSTGELYVMDVGQESTTSYIFGDNRHYIQTVTVDRSITTSSAQGTATFALSLDNDGSLVLEGESEISGRKVGLKYSENDQGSWELDKVTSINGQAPLDEPLTREALIAAGFDPFSYQNIGEANTILAASDTTNPTGTLDLSSNNADQPWWKDPQVQEFGDLLTRTQSLLSALKSGNSLALSTVVANAALPSSDLSAGLNIASDLTSLKSAIDRGDGLTALRSSLTLSRDALGVYANILEGQKAVLLDSTLVDSASQLADIESLNQVSSELTTVQSTMSDIGQGLAYLQAVIAIKDGEYAKGAILLYAAYYNIPWIGWAMAAYEIFKTMFTDDTPVGDARLVAGGADGTQIAVYADGDNGGDKSTRSMMEALLSALNDQIKDVKDRGILVNRMPQLHFRGGSNGGVWTLYVPDPNGGAADRRYFDLQGNMIGEYADGQWKEIAGADYFRKNIVQQFIEAASDAGAIAPLWEVQTAWQQRQHGDPQAGLATLERARLDGTLLAHDTQAQTQTVRPIVLDLSGDGIHITTALQGGSVLFDVDDDGFAEETDWVNPRDGILALDRDGNGAIDSGHELFSDVGVDTAKRGLRVLKEIDANGDNAITAADPAYAHLQVWRDVNMDGQAQDHELKSLSELGISQLDIGSGTFIMNGQTHQMAQASLNAAIEGVLTRTTTDGNVWVMHEDGSQQMFATQVADQTQSTDGSVHSAASTDGKLIAGYDGIETFEDTKISISAAQLLDNDRINVTGLDHDSLEISTVGTSASGGTVSYDAATGVIEFTPNTDFNGKGSFSYTVVDGIGRSATGQVTINVNAVNDAPVIHAAYSDVPVRYTELKITYGGSDSPTVYTLPQDIQLRLGVAANVSGISVLMPTETNWSDMHTMYVSGGVLINGQRYTLGRKNNGLYAGETVNGKMTWHAILRNDNYAYVGQIAASDAENGMQLKYSIVSDGRFGKAHIDENTGAWRYDYKSHRPVAGIQTNEADDAFVVRVTDQDGASTDVELIMAGKAIPVWQRQIEDWTWNFGNRRNGVGGDGGGFGASGGIGNGGACAGTSASSLPRKDPLALDLDGDGIETVGERPDGTSVLFDHDGDGIATGTGWLQPDDGWLALDLNGNGTIDNGTELFGADTFLKNGTRAPDGFTALREQDANGDGFINASDAVFANLRIWRDLNQDGISQTEELTTLTDNGITSIGVTATTNHADLGNGNVQTAAGTFTRSDGTIGMSGDTEYTAANLDLLVKTFDRQFTDTIALTDQAKALPQLHGAGQVRDLREAVSLSPDLGNWVQGYMQQTTRTGQIGMLDGFIEKWANTSDFKSLRQQADALAAQGVTLTYHFSGLTQGSPQYGEFLYKLDIVERFMGFTYAGSNGQAGITPLDANSGAVSVTLSAQQISNITLAYERFKADIYESLLLATRFNSYKDLLAPLSGATNDAAPYSALEAAFASAIVANPQKGLIDLIEFVSAIGETRAASLGWDAVDFLVDQVNKIGDLAAFSEELSSWTAKLASSSEHNATGTNRADLLVGTGNSDVISGGYGNDLILSKGGNDTLNGGAGDDTLDGGAGNDTLIDGTGHDTYLFGKGDGQDYIKSKQIADTSADKLSILRFKDSVLPQDVLATRVNGDLVITIAGTTDKVTVQDFFYQGNLNNPWSSVQQVKFADGTTWSLTDIATKAFTGTAANDTMTGTIGNDTMSGGAGNDTLSGSDGADVIYGGDGNDMLNGDIGDDALDGGAGNDTLYGGVRGTGNETYLFGKGDGQDFISSGSSVSGSTNIFGVLKFKSGVAPSEIAVRRNGNNLELSINATTDKITVQDFFAYNNTDSVWNPVRQVSFADGTVWGLDDIVTKALTGTPGDDTVTGTIAANAIYGGRGNDTIYGVDGNDSLYGQDEADYLSGDAGDDMLDGGAGSDTLYGGNGNDLLRGSDGIDLLYGDAGDDTLDGGIGNDTLKASTGNNTYLFGKGDNQDTVTSLLDYTVSKTNTLQFKTGVSTSEVIVRQISKNLELSISGTTDKITIQDFFYQDNMKNPYNPVQQVKFSDGSIWTTADLLVKVLGGTSGDDNIAGTSTADLITGLTGNDTLNGGAGDDTLDGGAGNDTLIDGTGHDTYLFGKGDGQDYIKSKQIADTSADKLSILRFKDSVLPQDVLATRVNGDLVITIAGTTDKVTVQDFFYQGNLNNPWSSVQQVKFADGTTWSLTDIATKAFTGTAANDTMTGTIGNDTMSGGAGNDTLSGSDGADVIYGGDGNDMLNGDIGDDALDGGAGNDTLYGGVRGTGNETYLFGKGDGQDFISSGSSVSGSTNIFGVLKFKSGVAPSEIAVRRNGNNLELSINATTDKITVQDFFAYNNVTSVWNPVRQVSFADGTVWGLDDIATKALTGTPGDDTITGTIAANTIYGGLGNDTIYGVDGNDSLYGQDGADYLSGDAGDDMLDGGMGNDTFYGGGGNDLITGSDGIDKLYGDAGNDILSGGTGNDTLDGGSGNDTLDGETGNDTLTGSTGNNTYLFGKGDGQDYIDSGTTIDTAVGKLNVVQFKNAVLPSEVIVRRVGGDLQLSISGTTDKITIEDFFYQDNTANSWNPVQQVRFADGTTWNISDVLLKVFNGTTGDDSITGTINNDIIGTVLGNDTISGLGGNDLLNGDTGNDSLDGGVGNDLLIGGIGNDSITPGAGYDIIAFNRGDGQDTATASTGKDNTLSLGNGITYAELFFNKAGNDLMLTTGVGEKIIFKDWYASTTNHSVANLQIVIEGTTDYDASSANGINNKKIEKFDFDGLVTAFDQARVANPTLTNWALSSSLLNFHLGGSDTAAIGGDFAYQYARNGNLSNISVNPAQALLGNTQFGTTAQTLQATNALQDASPRLM